MKLFQYHSNSWSEHDYHYQHHYQFLIIKDIVLLHLICEVDNPCPFTGLRFMTEFFAPSSLFGAEVQVKGYSWSFWLLSNYWRD